MYKVKNKYSDALYESEINAATAHPLSVTTRMTIAATPDLIFRLLMFYEEIGQSPPFFLRLLLPVPVGTKGSVSQVGDEVKCMYKRGEYLKKRITRIMPGEFYEFEVTRQMLTLRGNIRLSGGCFRLRELSYGKTEVSVKTRYYHTRRSPWYWILLERKVCQSFHRYLLGSIYQKIETN